MLLDFFKQRGRRFSESQDTCIWNFFWLFSYLQDGMEQSALNSGISQFFGFQKFCELCEIFKMIDLIANSGSQDLLTYQHS